jgi:uncharacterized membrane protein
MHFAYPFPWWAAVLAAAAIGALAFVEYRRPLVPLSRGRRLALASARGVVLAALVAFLFRPVLMMPPSANRHAVVPIVVDVSRSMRLADVDGAQTRIARAGELLQRQLLPALAGSFTPELFAAGDGVAPARPERLSADAPRSDLAAALDAVRERFRGERVAGIVLLSDGGDTTPAGSPAAAAAGPPVFAVGIGSSEGVPDREVLGVTAGDPRLDQASIDLHVSATSSGFGRSPFPLRVLANGTPVESRRIVPAADGSPVDETFTVSPDRLTPTVYTVEIGADDRDTVPENNARSILVNPAGRRRRVLMIEGAPGFEHSFIRRALSHDQGLDVDSVARKGKNAEGEDTFLVQAPADRSRPLLNGFPARREDLDVYDALVLANVEADFFTRDQLTDIAEFVSERGGGLLVLGEKSFEGRGLGGTPLEDVLPVDVNDRAASGHGGFQSPEVSARDKVVLTPEGEEHPIMRLGATVDATRRQWEALPALAATALLGPPRPGATVLAVAAAPGGVVHPIVAVQRYGQGRAMVFGGEGSWRWKMLVPSSNRSHEVFWRQAIRWLAAPSPDPVSVVVPEAPEPGDATAVGIVVRDAAYRPVSDAAVTATLTMPGGEARPLTPEPQDPTAGRYAARVQFARAGLFKIHVEARRGSSALGAAERWFYVGGAAREFVDPRLNEGFLRRLANASGGRYVRDDGVRRVVAGLEASVPRNVTPERRDLWHEPWAFAFVVTLLSAEWTFRRRWGLR